MGCSSGDTAAGDSVYKVARTSDFELNGQGSAETWEKAPWLVLSSRKDSSPLQTRARALYSDSGLYVLFENEDRQITATMRENFADLWHEDVVEIFLWTDEDFPVYFEYELSPLNYELPILIPNLKGKFLGWRPWHYEGERRTRHKIWIDSSGTGANKVKSWHAEFFIPFKLLTPLGNVPPGPGTRWRVNLYRGDYDLGHFESWAWQPVEKRFHEYEKFGTFVFE
ncbi:MAG: carbohydrate-binding family 9-like protein [Calditrichia bacterium]